MATKQEAREQPPVLIKLARPRRECPKRCLALLKKALKHLARRAKDEICYNACVTLLVQPGLPIHMEIYGHMLAASVTNPLLAEVHLREALGLIAVLEVTDDSDLVQGMKEMILQLLVSMKKEDAKRRATEKEGSGEEENAVDFEIADDKGDVKENEEEVADGDVEMADAQDVAE